VIDILDALDANPDIEAKWWARAFARQCLAALDELMLLAPSTISGIEKIPTLRELAGLGNQLASERIVGIERLATQSGELAAHGL